METDLCKQPQQLNIAYFFKSSLNTSEKTVKEISDRVVYFRINKECNVALEADNQLESNAEYLHRGWCFNFTKKNMFEISFFFPVT